jgi:V8-like Glu-specific endopeptidase
MSPNNKERMEQVRALFEQERQWEEEVGLPERFVAPSTALEAAGEADLDTAVSNEGPEAIIDLAASHFGTEGRPLDESFEVEATRPTQAASALEAMEDTALDESLLLDVYWASHGDASVRAMLRSQPADASILEVVIGDDDRREISATSQYPWRCICSLLITAADGSNWIGTGWLVGPRVLLTAGHCAYIHGRGGWAEQIEVIPGRRGVERPYGSCTATSFWSVKGWTDFRSRQYDYAAILLPAERRYGEELGWYGFAVRSDDALDGTMVNISGYPGDQPAGTQWFHAKKLADVGDRVLTYTIDTAGGQSGAPVWIKYADGGRYGVGIHTNGHITGNSATRINQAVFDNIKYWKGLVP